MFILKIAILFLFSTVLVRSDQSSGSLRTFKLSGNITYDCVDIFKQPTLDHPLLKTHIIQMIPSVLRPKSKNHVWDKAHKKKIRCPEGTVPILRNTNEYVSNVKRLEEMHFNPLTDSPGNTHMSGVRSTAGGPYHGVEGALNLRELKIEKDQASYAFIYLGTETNFIQAGWMINPGVFGDQRVWSYGFWRGKNGEGCYNVNCPGFVQVAKDDPIGYPNPHFPGEAWYRFSIHKDEKTGNWWLTQIRTNQPDTDIGYWPKELFDFMSDDAKRVGAAGAVQASSSGSCPPMGNGIRPNENPRNSALFLNVGVLDSNNKKHRIDYTEVIVTLNGEKCYGYKKGRWNIKAGFYFNYGGPGGKWC